MKRIVELDILRGLAMVGVIGIHATIYVLPSYLHYWPQSPTLVYLNQLFRFATPLLIFLSGVTLTLSQMHRPLSPLQFYRRRFSRVLIPYVIWSIIFTVYYAQTRDWSLIGAAGRNIIDGKSDYHMYFILLLVQFYLLFPFLFWWLSRLAKKQRLGLVSAAILLQTVLLFVFMQFRIHNAGFSEDIAFRIFPFWLAYFLFGMVWAEQFVQGIVTISRLSLPLLALGTVLFAGLLTFETKLYTNLTSYDALDFFRPSVFAYCWLSVPLLVKLSSRMVQSTNNALEKLRWFLHLVGRHSLGIYLLHTILLAKIAGWILSIRMPYSLAAVSILLATLVATLVCVMVYNLVVTKTKTGLALKYRRAI